MAAGKKTPDISCGCEVHDEWHKYFIPQSVYLSTVAYSTKGLWANNLVGLKICSNSDTWYLDIKAQISNHIHCYNIIWLLIHILASFYNESLCFN